jgi:hypothetical protein
MGDSRRDRFWDGIDRLGRRFPGASTIAQTSSSQAFQKFARNRPFLGSLAGSVFFVGAILALSLLRTGGGHFGLLMLISGIVGALFFFWIFLYNHRHHIRDQDLEAVPSAESNRLSEDKQGRPGLPQYAGSVPITSIRWPKSSCLARRESPAHLGPFHEPPT